MKVSSPSYLTRFRIDHVEKVLVKQSKGIEGTYYYIGNAEDQDGEQGC